MPPRLALGLSIAALLAAPPSLAEEGAEPATAAPEMSADPTQGALDSGDLEEAPDAGTQPTGKYRHPEPLQVWNEILSVRDEIHHYTEEEDLATVLQRIAQLDELRRKLYLGIQERMDMTTEAKRLDPARTDDLVKLIQTKRALNFLWVTTGHLQNAAASGVPGRVRDLYFELDNSLEIVERWVPAEYIIGGTPAPGS